jgi:hypothetical protein
MITYFTPDDILGKWATHDDVTPEVHENIFDLIKRVNAVCEVADMDGIDFPFNQKTLSYVSGEQYGGFRPQDCPIGAEHSSHKAGKAVDIFDPKHEISMYFYKHQALLKEHGLAMEHPSKTLSWAHLTSRLPPSGKTVFYP